MAKIVITFLLIQLYLALASGYMDSVNEDGSKGKMTYEQEREQLLKEVEELRWVKQQLRNENDSDFRPADCAELFKSGVRESGVHAIYPFTCSCHLAMRVYCDMKTDDGGWTVLLKRESQSPQENFNRSWDEYKAGFGSPYGEYFLGLENIYQLTGSRSYIARWDWTTTAGALENVMYNNFEIADEDSRYKLTMGTMMDESTTGRDCYSYNKNRYFSTHDRDSDYSSSNNCASLGGGGFWYYSCFLVYPPTGVYEGYMNHTCQRSNYGYSQVSRFQLKVRPLLCESSYKRISSYNDRCPSTCNHYPEM